MRTLRERREQDAGASGPARARSTLIVAIGALVVAIVKGQDWGWGSPAILALLAVTAVLLPAIWRRSERHPAPVVDPAMLRVRSFGLAVGASVLFFAGFGAMLLGGVLFLTAVWHEEVLTRRADAVPRARRWRRPSAIPSARLGARFGYRLPGVVGALLFASGSALVHHPDRRHARTTSSEYLPGMLISGAGVGLVIPTLTGRGRLLAAARALRDRRRGADDGPPDRRGARRGGARGRARHGRGHAPRTSTRRWLITVVGGLLAGGVLAAIGRRRWRRRRASPSVARADRRPARSARASSSRERVGHERRA